MSEAKGENWREALPITKAFPNAPGGPVTARSALLAWSETLPAHLLYIAGVICLVLTLPIAGLSDTQEYGLFLGLGVLAAWRYSWGVLHFTRSNIYRFIVYPRLKQAAGEQLRIWRESGKVPHTFLIVTSFRIDGDTSSQVYRAVFQAAHKAPGKVTVVASIVEMADQRLVRSLHKLICGADDHVNLVITRIAGSGKRDALGYAFRAVSKAEPEPEDVVAVIDGDSIVPPDLIEKCIGYFGANPKVGALTTDEISYVHGRAAFHIWYSLRFAQRHILMSSNGLARRVLTLTGRMSMFRASVICNPEFIQQVETDYIEHWRFGHLKFLTGDDKSSWYWLLRNGYKMLYIPDVVVATIEEPPTQKFFPAATQLMVRWFGNMLRTNSRALALGPGRIGYFTWWTIFDQRISMWTSLAGLVMVILIGILKTPFAFAAYLVWILTTRYIFALMLFNSRPRISVFYPFFIYFNQIYGSLVKTFIFFRLNRQKWTRQKTTLKDGTTGFSATLRDGQSAALHTAAMVFFFTLIAILIGQLSAPDFATTATVLGLV